jgi:hypothetical protein
MQVKALQILLPLQNNLTQKFTKLCLFHSFIEKFKPQVKKKKNLEELMCLLYIV